VGAVGRRAGGTGTGCMVNAPGGATVGGIDFGHVGWAFQVVQAPKIYFDNLGNAGWGPVHSL
jgi:hypothetical protein